MNLPIGTVAAAVGAARLARSVVSQVQGMRFAEILGDAGASDAAETLNGIRDSINSLAGQLTAAASERLSEMGLTINGPLRLNVLADGRIKTDGSDQLSLQIESLLNSDRRIVETAQRIAEKMSAAGQDTIPITID